MIADPSILAATVLAAVLVGVAGCLTLGVRRRPWRSVLLAGAVGGGLFQLGHFAEHVGQAGYWSAHRDQSPWMTPWANALARSFQALAPGTPGFGMEALHLVGNLIFLAGAAAILAVLAGSGVHDERYGRLARAGVGVQALHLAEHVALTVSVVVAGYAGGTVASPDGHVLLSVGLDVDEVGPETILGEGALLKDVAGSVILLIMRSHGPATEGQIDVQTTSYAGGCETTLYPPEVPDAEGECVEIQFSIHQPAT